LTVAVFTSTLFVTEASAGTLKVLHSFNGADGRWPTGVLLDTSGNLYGVAFAGGRSGYGLVFQLTPSASGRWNEKALIQFNHTTGMYPNPVVFDSVGNLYGTLEQTTPRGTGAVFELSPTTDGRWDEKILNIMEKSEGAELESSVTFDASGNIFSTAFLGGENRVGTIFELSPTTDGPWQETTLESFDPKDGNNPECKVVFDAAGNMYGTTSYGGGLRKVGTVWELTPQTDGTWTETVLHSFTGETDGAIPIGGVIFDAAGNLYGMTSMGGAFKKGTVFELSPNGDGAWTKTVLYNFRGRRDGSTPYSTLTFDSAGSLYGETHLGGAGPCGESGCGVVFELSPTGGRRWRESVLYRFNGTDGQTPWQGLVFDAAGNLYGTTQNGGAFGNGTVFELKP
jgi:uncharacterized repeat protein (TIGR03803 family)